MEQKQINLRLGLSLFHCQSSCLVPFKPPTFKCEYMHVICGSCCNSHEQVCRGAVVYSRKWRWMRSCATPSNRTCAYQEFGWKSSVVYFEAAEDQRACPWAPYSCPDQGCGFFSSSARLADHLAGAYSWPVTEVSNGKPLKVALLPPPRGWHVLVASGASEEDRDRRVVFLLSVCRSRHGGSPCVAAMARLAPCSSAPPFLDPFPSVPSRPVREKAGAD